jgi:hypothetical protein
MQCTCKAYCYFLLIRTEGFLCESDVTFLKGGRGAQGIKKADIVKYQLLK